MSENEDLIKNSFVQKEEIKNIKKKLKRQTIILTIAILIFYVFMFWNLNSTLGMELVSRDLVILGILGLIVYTFYLIVTRITYFKYIKEFEETELIEYEDDKYKKFKKVLGEESLNYSVLSAVNFIIIFVYSYIMSNMNRGYLFLAFLSLTISSQYIVEAYKKSKEVLGIKKVCFLISPIIIVLISSYLGYSFNNYELSKIDDLEKNVDIKFLTDKPYTELDYYKQYRKSCLATYLSQSKINEDMNISYKVFESDFEFLINHYTEKSLEDTFTDTYGETYKYKQIKSSLPSEMTVYQMEKEGNEENQHLNEVIKEEISEGIDDDWIYYEVKTFIIVNKEKLVIADIDAREKSDEELIYFIYEQLF